MSQIYLISPPQFEYDKFLPVLDEVLEQKIAKVFQLRLKEQEILPQQASELLNICRRHDVVFIINDDYELCKAIGADGVHIGPDDGKVALVRSVVGNDAVIGVSCKNSKHLAMEAAEAGADYVSFGAFFPTKTKNTPYIADIDLLSWWSSWTEVPCVAIGGINHNNIGQIRAAGADFIAIISSVWDYPNGAADGIRLLSERL
jgi:thiamine-phosphate pyrophosphorylase